MRLAHDHSATNCKCTGKELHLALADLTDYLVFDSGAVAVGGFADVFQSDYHTREGVIKVLACFPQFASYLFGVRAPAYRWQSRSSADAQQTPNTSKRLSE